VSLREEFERLAVPIQNDLWFAARSFARTEADALDLLQDAWLKAYRAFPSFQPTDGGFKAWMYTILRNAHLDRCRARRLEPVPFDVREDLIEGPGAAELPLAELLPDDLLRALRSLSPRHQLLIHLCDMEGFTYREIASILGCPIGSVMSGLHNARAHLRNSLSPK
jgi:RNA polymerase sigma-70 factor, ECF subfamily